MGGPPIRLCMLWKCQVKIGSHVQLQSWHWIKDKHCSGEVPEKVWGLLKALRMKGCLQEHPYAPADKSPLCSVEHNSHHPRPTSLSKLGIRAHSVILQRSLRSHFQYLFPPLSSHSKKILTAIEQFFAQIFLVPWNVIWTVRTYFWRVSVSDFRLSCQEMALNFFLDFKECLPSAHLPPAHDHSRRSAGLHPRDLGSGSAGRASKLT